MTAVGRDPPLLDEEEHLLHVNSFSNDYGHRENHREEPIDEIEESQTVVAIRECEDRFLPFYSTLLKLVGWEPIFEHTDSKFKKFLNWLPIISVLICVIFGYFVQMITCLNRDSGSYDQEIIPLHPAVPINTTINTTVVPPYPEPDCKQSIVSQFIIPDVLHLVAYVYSLYVMREKETENLRNLAVRTYRMISQTNRAVILRNRLLKGIKAAIILLASLVFLSLIASIISLVGIHAHIGFYWFHPSETSKFILLTLMVIAFIAFDVVYVAVVMNYCVQCQLMIYYIKGLKENIENKKFELIESKKKIIELKDHMHVLNYKIGIALSMLIFSFASLLSLGLYKIIFHHNMSLVTASSILFIIYWSTIICVPVIQAVRLSGHCHSLTKTGHRVRIHQFYQNIGDTEMDSFVLFTSSLDMNAKIFLIPVRLSCVSSLMTITLFVLLLLFQTGLLSGTAIHRSSYVNQGYTGDVEARLEDSSVTRRAIEVCDAHFFKLYRRLMLLVGWEAIFDDTQDEFWCGPFKFHEKYRTFCNRFPIVLVLVAVVIGYCIQAISCSDREVGGFEKEDIKDGKVVEPRCEHVVISQYIIPDLLHLFAYLYSLYVMRSKETENLRNLAYRTFELTSLSKKETPAQRNLIRTMRAIPVVLFLLILLTITSETLTIVSANGQIGFYFINSSPKWVKYTLLTFMMISFIFFDIIYLAVVVNYCVQCQLIIAYSHSLKKSIEERKFPLIASMKKISELQKHLYVLNYKIAIAYSILLFNFGTSMIVGTLSFLNHRHQKNQTLSEFSLEITSTFLFIIYWSLIALVPIIQAMRVSAHCNSLKKVGSTIRVKPFVYAKTDDKELDSFLIYTSSLDLSAKIFLVPVQTCCMSLIIVTSSFTLLVLFQMSKLYAWLPPPHIKKH